MDKLRILVVDDHDDFRRGLRALLDATESLEVVGVATNGATAVSMALDLQPDVIVMDLHMPELNGIEATERIVAFLPAHRRAGGDDDGGRGVGLRGGAGGCAGLPAQGRAPTGDHPVHRGRRGRGGHLRARHRRADDVVLQGGPEQARTRPLPSAHRSRADGARSHRRRAGERRDRGRARASPPRPSATTRATSSRSSRSLTGRRRSSLPGRPVWTDRQPTRVDVSRTPRRSGRRRGRPCPPAGRGRGRRTGRRRRPRCAGRRRWRTWSPA